MKPLYTLFWLVWILCSPASAADYSIYQRIEGPVSPYTEWVVALLRNWPPKRIHYSDKEEGNPVKLAAFSTTGNEDYIGLEQWMYVDTPIQAVESILDDFAHYKDLFPGYDDVHEVSRDQNLAVIFWEQHIPLFFVPNVKYEMFYLIDKSNPNRKIYRYKLRKQCSIKKSDGVIVIEQIQQSSGHQPLTRYTEYDFFDAEWGPVKTFAPSRIWGDSVEGLYLSDVAIKLKAEHTDWNYEKIAKESKRLLDAYPVEAVIKAKKPFVNEFR